MTLPFANNTEKIEWKLARRSQAADRRRNLVAVFTIALAVCLMGFAHFCTRHRHSAASHRFGGSTSPDAPGFPMRELSSL